MWFKWYSACLASTQVIQYLAFLLGTLYVWALRAAGECERDRTHMEVVIPWFTHWPEAQQIYQTLCLWEMSTLDGQLLLHTIEGPRFTEGRKIPLSLRLVNGRWQRATHGARRASVSAADIDKHYSPWGKRVITRGSGLRWASSKLF
jgi:hypothetical protein